MLASRDRPILEGFRLVQSLCLSSRVIVVTSGKKSRVEYQLRTEGITDQIADIYDETLALAPLPLWERQIEVVRSRYPVDYVVSADPDIIEWCLEHDLNALLFAHRGFSRPTQRPGQGHRSWESLRKELDARMMS